MRNKEIQEAMEAQGKDIQEITTAIEASKSRINVPVVEPDYTIKPTISVSAPEPVPFMPVAEKEESADELGLTEDDARYLKLRWGKAYKPSE